MDVTDSGSRVEGNNEQMTAASPHERGAAASVDGGLLCQTALESAYILISHIFELADARARV